MMNEGSLIAVRDDGATLTLAAPINHQNIRIVQMGCVEISGNKSYASLLAILGQKGWKVKVSQRTLRNLQSTEPPKEKTVA
jgi:hypothetical protein